GVTKEVEDKIAEMGFEIIDATCPFVKKIHDLVSEYSEDKNNKILIIGDKDHPEVVGICGRSHTEPIIIANEEEALDYSKNNELKHIIVTQTTFNSRKMKRIVEILAEKSYDIIVLNTICNATESRQAEAEELAEKVDCMIVIGGKHSSNTQKLYDICIKKCVDTYYIQTLVDLDLKSLRSFRCVGITAGASTPNNIIEEVQKHVRNEF
ncbi:MAG: 4-hydroxy-3-methylbut-2-enyl diphosphate reductase, partial [Lachnospiraceae bacterium]|nr:4-hydroxy-3-methylbut-2-enyl diphosphate reductase [Lachnospiraceae bacterium]